MSDENDFYTTTRVIAFEPEGGLLGVDTNGAAPQRIHGLFVEAQAFAIDTAQDRFCDAPEEHYWIKATMRPDLSTELNDAPYPEFVAFASDLSEVERIFGAIANASFVSGYDKKLAGSYAGYQNSSQTRFSDEASEECAYDLGCRVNASPSGFELRLFDKKATIASVHGKLAPNGIDETLAMLAELRTWRDEKFRILERQIAKRETEEAPTPGM